MSRPLMTAKAERALAEVNKYFYRPMIVKEKNSFLKKVSPSNTFMSVFGTIQVPEGAMVTEGTIFHEAQHYSDQCVYHNSKFDAIFIFAIWWYMKYFMPHILAVFSLVSLLAIPYSIHFLWALGFMIFALPITYLAKYRRTYEMRGFYWSWLFGRREFKEVFSGKMYYYMDYKNSDKFYQIVFNDMYRYIEDKPQDNMYVLHIAYSDFMEKELALKQ